MITTMVDDYDEDGDNSNDEVDYNDDEMMIMMVIKHGKKK